VEMVTAALRDILLDHAGRYPAMQMQDVYKLLHQAALGSGHAVRDEQAARDWLERELVEMGDGSDEPLLDPISPSGQIVRVHLRPYLRAGRKPEALLHAFVRTANEFRGSKGKLKQYGASTARMATKGWLPFARREVELFFAEIEKLGFPAVQHSETYKRAYRPAYRVVAREYLLADKDLIEVEAHD